MKVCLLSEREQSRLLNYNTVPNCEEHRHLAVAIAIEGLRDGIYERCFVDGDDDFYGVVFAKEHTLAVKSSGGIPVVQRIVGNGYKHIQEAR